MEALQKTVTDEIIEQYREFKRNGSTLEESFVAHANKARNIGLLIGSWSGQEQISFEFYLDHAKDLRESIPFETLKMFVTIARRLPEPATTIADVRSMWQLDFIACGLLALPERGAEHASQTTPYCALLNRIGGVRAEINKWINERPLAQWDEDTRQNVRAQLKPLIEFYESL